MCRLLLCVVLGVNTVAPARATAMNLDQYLGLLDHYGVQTLDQAVSLLPRELLSNFTLLYAGRGLRETSYEKPSALLFGLDGKFVVTFNSADQRTGNTLEIMQFIEPGDRFEMYELAFPLARDAQNRIIRPEANPPKCLRCHQQDSRPIWGPYPTVLNQMTWKGAYGSAEDFLNRTEQEGLRKFWSTTGKGDRFRHLLPPKGSPMSPYSLKKRDELLFRPNARYMSLALRLTARRVARQIMTSPAYATLKTRVLWTFMSCESLERTGTRFWLGESDPLEELIRSLGLKPADFAVTFEEIFPLGKFDDGSYAYTLRNLVGNLIFKDIVQVSGDPDLASLQKDLYLATSHDLENNADVMFETYGDEIARLPADAEPNRGIWRPEAACEILKRRYYGGGSAK